MGKVPVLEYDVVSYLNRERFAALLLKREARIDLIGDEGTFIEQMLKSGCTLL